jgi:hypothetical protein
MTADFAEYDRLNLTAKEEDEILDKVTDVLTEYDLFAMNMAESRIQADDIESPPFHGQLRPLLEGDELRRIVESAPEVALCGHKRRFRYQTIDGCFICDLEAERERLAA